MTLLGFLIRLLRKRRPMFFSPRLPKLQLIKTRKPPNTGSKKKGPVFAGPFFPKRDDPTGKHCNRSG